jgi:hypothetical protein
MSIATKGYGRSAWDHVRRGIDRVVYAYKLRIRGEQRTALASYPRSGNTWLRRLLEEATGQSCGTIYEAETILPAPDAGLAIKTHMRDAYRYSRAIHLVRHPLDVLESYYCWKRDCAGGKDMEWERFIDKRSAAWVRHTRYWMGVSCDVFRLRYEDLVADPFGRLQALIQWLGLDISDEGVRAAVEACSFESLKKEGASRGQPQFFRRGTVGDSLGNYTEEQLSMLRARFAPLLEEWGYDVSLEPEGSVQPGP